MRNFQLDRIHTESHPRFGINWIVGNIGYKRNAKQEREYCCKIVVCVIANKIIRFISLNKFLNHVNDLHINYNIRTDI